MSQPEENRPRADDSAAPPSVDLTEPPDRLPGEDEAVPDAPESTGAEPAEDRGHGTPEPPG